MKTYEELRRAALRNDASQKDIDALGAWLAENETRWNGENYTIEGEKGEEIDLYPVAWMVDEDEWEYIGYTFDSFGKIAKKRYVVAVSVGMPKSDARDEFTECDTWNLDYAKQIARAEQNQIELYNYKDHSVELRAYEAGDFGSYDTIDF